MTRIAVDFVYRTGVKRSFLRNARLTGSWNAAGHQSEAWSIVPMRPEVGEDGCPGFRARMRFDDSQVGRTFRWGVITDTPANSDLWAIPSEVNDHTSEERYRTFRLHPPPDEGRQEERYYLTHCRRLGANKHYVRRRRRPAARFSVWAPNAEAVEVVFGNPASGYIADDGTGTDPQKPPLALVRKEEGVWEADSETHPELRFFASYDHVPYMFRITKRGQGLPTFRTDLYSRCQIGSGRFDPRGQPYRGSYRDLDGTKSCSVTIDPETVERTFGEPTRPERDFVPEETFWENEFSQRRPIPSRIEDLVIYELHVGAIDNGTSRPGDIGDAIGLLDYLEDLGVNAIELLPMSEFEGWANWGYGTSHHFAIEYSAGGRDHFKHLVRACHQRGIAVILDVVYNHYHHDAERAQWAYDSDRPEENIHYWYEGRASDYPDANPTGHGGYVDNMSTGYAPRFHEEMVRKLFVSSAVALMEEFHVDGFRVDQTTSMHLYNVLHADGRPLGRVNAFGAKILRELTRTLKLIKPSVFLIAEDHSHWAKVTEPTDQLGLGFDAAWYADFYHHLVGDGDRGPEYAKLLREAGYGQNQPLRMGSLASALSASAHRRVVYHESHDEAGNASDSQRTMVTAVGGAPLVGDTRRFAEARSRFAFGLSCLSAGTPLFLMGEEIGAAKEYRHDTFLWNREDLWGERAGDGKRMFAFYRDLIRFRLAHPALRSRNLDVVHVHDENRVIAFRRWDECEELLVVASLNDQPFEFGYEIGDLLTPDGAWRESFNSDAKDYGGQGVGNFGRTQPSTNGAIDVVIPRNGFVVFQRMA